jgi:hypothetical protein
MPEGFCASVGSALAAVSAMAWWCRRERKLAPPASRKPPPLPHVRRALVVDWTTLVVGGHVGGGPDLCSLAGVRVTGGDLAEVNRQRRLSSVCLASTAAASSSTSTSPTEPAFGAQG